jgi:hypothetical protein
VSLTATDAVSGIRAAFVTATPPVEIPNSPRGTPVIMGVSDPSEGTITDGVWTGTLSMPGGSGSVWKLSVDLYDRMNNKVTLTTEQLEARGFPTEITTRTTAAPPKPTNVKATSGIATSGGWVVDVRGDAQRAGDPFASEWSVTGTAPCGTTSNSYGPGFVSFSNRTGVAGICAVTLRAVNAAGSSAPVTVYAFVGP